jgi:predicted Rossmann fold nucleotide-binding protein DprA/Smf involved in DNA uptake
MTKAYIYNSLTDDEKRIYKILSDEPLYIDDILNMSRLERRKMSKALLSLELKRLVTELPGKQFIRKGN